MDGFREIYVLQDVPRRRRVESLTRLLSRLRWLQPSFMEMFRFERFSHFSRFLFPRLHVSFFFQRERSNKSATTACKMYIDVHMRINDFYSTSVTVSLVGNRPLPLPYVINIADAAYTPHAAG